MTDSSKKWVLFCFFLSGMTALIYELVWTRWLVLIFGSTTFAISTVLTTFMAGLGLGSFLFGRFMMVRKRNPLLIYALLEAGIGLYAILFPLFLPILEASYGVIWETLHLQFYTFSLVRFFLMGIILIIPTTMMGATFPVLGRYMARENKGIGHTLGFLYFLNTSGAILGCFAGGFIFLPFLGLFNTTLLAVMVNLFIALGIIFLLRLEREREGKKVFESGLEGELLNKGPESSFPLTTISSKPTEPWGIQKELKTGEKPVTNKSVAVVLIVFALSGFSAMVYEVAWSRALSLVLGSSVYAFSAMLTTFLAGLAFGSFVSASVVERITFRFLFIAFIQIATGIFAYMTLLGLGNLPKWMVTLYGYFFEERSFGTPLLFPLIQFLLSFSVMFLPTFLLGMMFPLVARIYRDRIQAVSRVAGDTYSVNTLGAIFGAFSGGFIIIPVLGIQYTLLLMVGLNLACGLVILGLSLTRGWGKPLVFIFLLGFFLTVFSFFPPQWNQKVMTSGVFWNLQDFHDINKGSFKDEFNRFVENQTDLLFYREGLTATVTVERDIKNIMNLKVNGRKESSSRYMRTQVLLSHLPLLMAQDPKNVLIIGLGSGVTVGSASLHPVQEIKAVELESTILEASRFFGDVNYQPWNDPRVELIVDDGRNYLLANGSSFDVIISQPSIPWITGASNLFTQEFFQLVAKRLKEGGVFSQWFSSTDALGVDHYLSAFKAFTRVFPFVMVFETTPGDLLWIGSKNPLNINYDKVLAKISKLEIAKDLQRIDIDGISDLLSLYLGGDESISTLIDGATINTDDKNYVEFFGPYYYFETKGGGTHVSQVLYPKLPPKVLNTMISLAVNHPMDLNPFLLQLSASSLKQGRLPNALSYVNAALEEKSNGEGHLLKAKVLDRYRIFGGNKESRSLLIKSERGELKRALLDENSSLETLEGIAQGFETLGDIRRAEEIYLDLIRTNPRSAYIQTQLGDFYLRLKNQEKAIQAYQKAIQIDSNQFNPHLQLALLYQNTGDFKEAEAILVKLINKSSSNQKTTALFHLADLQRERGRLEEAARIYQEVLVLDPNHFLAHNNLGNIYQATGNMEGALQAYKVAIQIQPTFFEAYLNLGAVSQRMGRLDQAYQAYQTAIGLNPTDPSGYYNLGFLLKEQGNVEKAVDFFNQFITLAQGNVLFANQLQIARTHLSDLNRLD